MMIDERRDIVERFLERCIAYSNASIERKEHRNDNLEDINKWKHIEIYANNCKGDTSKGIGHLA